ncbi:DUF1963 domain-containing protein [Escherichia albertii]|nr:DUF1963 domain-containing protein [Escherichia albertii]
MFSENKLSAQIAPVFHYLVFYYGENQSPENDRMFTSKTQIARSLIDAGVKPEEARTIAEHARSAVQLIPQHVKNEESVPLGVTKIGGKPDLPQGMEWPWRPAYPEDANCMAGFRERATRTVDEWHWGTPEQRMENCEYAKRELYAVENTFPLSFIAQINFAEMWATGEMDEDLPREGMLFLFYDLSVQPWGFDPKENVGFSVRYHSSGERLIRREIPEELPWLYNGDMGAIFTCDVAWKLSPLEYETAQWELSGLSDETGKMIYDWRLEHEDAPAHQVGGWSSAIQGDMQVKCALVSAGHYCGSGDVYEAPELALLRATATEWLLLAQIDSDENGDGWMWGDCGRLYLWIKRSDLIARRFERAQLIQQCF